MGGAAVAAGAVIAVVAAVDELTDVVLRWPGPRPAGELDELLHRRAAVAAGGGGVTGWGYGAAAVLYLVEMIVRQAMVFAALVAAPLIAADLRGWRRSPRRMTAVRWVLTAIVIKPALALALIVGIEVAPAGGLLALVTVAALLVLLISGPVTMFQLLAFLDPGTSTEQRAAGQRPTRSGRGGPIDPSRPPDAGCMPRDHAARARRPAGECAPAGAQRVAAAVRAAVHAIGCTAEAGTAPTRRTVGAGWPVVREIRFPYPPGPAPESPAPGRRTDRTTTGNRHPVTPRPSRRPPTPTRWVPPRTEPVDDTCSEARSSAWIVEAGFGSGAGIRQEVGGDGDPPDLPADLLAGTSTTSAPPRPRTSGRDPVTTAAADTARTEAGPSEAGSASAGSASAGSAEPDSTEAGPAGAGPTETGPTGARPMEAGSTHEASASRKASGAAAATQVW